MSHIERKKIRGHIYLYRYQSYRDEAGRGKKKFIKYLGPEERLVSASQEGSGPDRL